MYRYALVGSAAVLSGITRMTLTIAVILIELSKDVGALIPIVVTVTAAKMAGSLLYVGFDDALISLRKVSVLPGLSPILVVLTHSSTTAAECAPPCPFAAATQCNSSVLSLAPA